MSKNTFFKSRDILLSLVVGFMVGTCGRAADSDVLSELAKAKSELTRNEYVLRYKFQPGESIRYHVEQLTTIENTIDGNTQKTKLSTKSTRSFDVRDVTEDGNMKFDHRILDTEMWNEVTGREAIHYNSRTDKESPPEFAGVSDHIGKPISVITVSPRGAIVARDDQVAHLDLGLGGLTIPLPEQAIAIGYEWSRPLDLKVRSDDKRIKVIKTRELYRLKKVETGVATIAVQTQILTPINDAKIKAQIIQRISRGEIRFDVDAGRLLSKQLDFDEVVLGFSGPQSRMNYLARFTETLETPKVARKAQDQK